MKTIVIHNTSGSAVNWYRDFAVDEKFTVPNNPALLAKYQTCDALVTAIGSGDAIIENDDGAIALIADQVSWLLQVTPNTVVVVDSNPFSTVCEHCARFEGFKGTATAGTTTNIDTKIVEERHINGVEAILNNHSIGDSMGFEIVDVDNIKGFGAGTVLSPFGANWYVAADTQKQTPVVLEFTGTIAAGLYIRIVYNSVGSTDVDVFLNCRMYKA